MIRGLGQTPEDVCLNKIKKLFKYNFLIFDANEIAHMLT